MQTENNSVHLTDNSDNNHWLSFLARGGTVRDGRHIDQTVLDAIYKVAFGRFQSGVFQDALLMFRYLCLLDHRRYDYFLGLGGAQAKLGFYDQAAATLAYAEQLSDGDPRASLEMGHCFVEMKQLNLAEQALDETIRRSILSKQWFNELDRARQLMNYVQAGSRREDNG